MTSGHPPNKPGPATGGSLVMDVLLPVDGSFVILPWRVFESSVGEDDTSLARRGMALGTCKLDCVYGCNAMIRSDAAPKIQAGRTFRVGRGMQYVRLPMKDESAEQSHIDRTNSSSNMLHASTTSRVRALHQ